MNALEFKHGRTTHSRPCLGSRDAPAARRPAQRHALSHAFDRSTDVALWFSLIAHAANKLHR